MINSPIVNLRLALAATAVSLLFTGCGLAETTAVAASEAESAAEQAKQGKEAGSQGAARHRCRATGRGRRARQGRGRTINKNGDSPHPSNYSRIPVPRFMKTSATANSATARPSMMAKAT